MTRIGRHLIRSLKSRRRPKKRPEIWRRKLKCVFMSCAVVGMHRTDIHVYMCVLLCTCVCSHVHVCALMYMCVLSCTCVRSCVH